MRACPRLANISFVSARAHSPSARQQDLYVVCSGRPLPAKPRPTPDRSFAAARLHSLSLLRTRYLAYSPFWYITSAKVLVYSHSNLSVGDVPSAVGSEFNLGLKSQAPRELSPKALGQNPVLQKLANHHINHVLWWRRLATDLSRPCCNDARCSHPL